MRGKFVVVDGLDGIGKGVIENAILDFEKSKGRLVFDSIKWCKKNPRLRPDLDLIKNGDYNIVLTGEPTYSCLGLDIRDEMISVNNEREYSAESLIQGYSLDREIQMKRFVVPSLINGYDVVQSRSLAATCCYQLFSACGIEHGSFHDILSKILNHPGNKYQLENRPDLLIIPTIGNMEELVSRCEKRKKKENAIFENIEFQREAKPLFESDWLREIFEKVGTKVAYLDAGISIESTREQAIEIYDAFCSTRDVSDKFRKISLLKDV